MWQKGWLVAVVGMATLVGAGGCKRSGSDQAAAPAPAATAAATAEVVATAPLLHPCDILANASVAAAVAGSQAGLHVDDDEAAGISTCRWAVGDGAVVLQTFDPGPGALPHELRGATLDIVDVQRKDAASLVRLEKIDGVGDLAGAFVERPDSKRGIRKSGAVLMVQKGNRLAVLRIPQLAGGDRALALASMKKLGLEIASGL